MIREATKEDVTCVAQMAVMMGNSASVEELAEEFETVLENEECAIYLYCVDNMPLIRKYAKQGIGEYVELIKAVMMQEFGGQGNDPMKSSEGNFNEKYPRIPDGITDSKYSIECGVKEMKSCLASAEVISPMNMDNIKLALQGYNYGNGYIIPWAKANYGRYTLANAAVFSDKMAEKKRWESYGDKQYVPHVLRYYSLRRIPNGAGD